MRRDPLYAVLERLGPVKPSGGWKMARCPAHDDTKDSLGVTTGDNGKVILKCHAGCSFDAILTALGFTPADLVPEHDERGEWTPRGTAAAVYDYTDGDGSLLFQVLRTFDKSFSQRRPDRTRDSGWTWNLEGVRRVLFRLPKLPGAIADGRRVFIVEGEKDVLALEAVGEVATCNPGGAGKWRPEYVESLRGASEVYVIADRDEPGQRHARQVAQSLEDACGSVFIVEPSKGKDVSDHLSAGLSLDELVVTKDPKDRGPSDLAPDLWEFLAETDTYDWIVEGLLERGDRMMLTGTEGLGKSTLIRQMAVCIAAGLHPLRLGPMKPLRVLVVDCENSRAHVRRKLRPLAQFAEAAGRSVSSGALRLIVKPEGVDLTMEDDAAWLLERVTAHKPDVLFLGPLYRLHAANPNDELVARKLVAAVDAARLSVECAVVMEAHAGHGETGVRRHVRPTGSSLYLRWPEFGYGLVPRDKDDGVDFLAWRGPRDEREWPTRLDRGSVWPWEGVWK